jgi:hypothetical protein
MAAGIKTREPVYCAMCGRCVGEIDDGVETEGIYVYCKSLMCGKKQPVTINRRSINQGGVNKNEKKSEGRGNEMYREINLGH